MKARNNKWVKPSELDDSAISETSDRQTVAVSDLVANFCLGKRLPPATLPLPSLPFALSSTSFQSLSFHFPPFSPSLTPSLESGVVNVMTCRFVHPPASSFHPSSPLSDFLDKSLHGVVHFVVSSAETPQTAGITHMIRTQLISH